VISVYHSDLVFNSRNKTSHYIIRINKSLSLRLDNSYSKWVNIYIRKWNIELDNRNELVNHIHIDYSYINPSFSIVLVNLDHSILFSDLIQYSNYSSLYYMTTNRYSDILQLLYLSYIKSLLLYLNRFHLLFS